MTKCECGRRPELVKRWFKAQWRDECGCGRCGPWMVRAHEYLVPDKHPVGYRARVAAKGWQAVTSPDDDIPLTWKLPIGGSCVSPPPKK